MSDTRHHNPELSTKYLRETSDALATYMHRMSDYAAFDELNAQLASAVGVFDAGAEHVFPYTREELAWFRHSITGVRS